MCKYAEIRPFSYEFHFGFSGKNFPEMTLVFTGAGTYHIPAGQVRDIHRGGTYRPVLNPQSGLKEKYGNKSKKTDSGF